MMFASILIGRSGRWRQLTSTNIISQSTTPVPSLQEKQDSEHPGRDRGRHHACPQYMREYPVDHDVHHCGAHAEKEIRDHVFVLFV